MNAGSHSHRPPNRAYLDGADGDSEKFSFLLRAVTFIKLVLTETHSIAHDQIELIDFCGDQHIIILYRRIMQGL